MVEFSPKNKEEIIGRREIKYVIFKISFCNFCGSSMFFIYCSSIII